MVYSGFKAVLNFFSLRKKRNVFLNRLFDGALKNNSWKDLL